MIIVNAWVAYNAVEIEAGGGWQASFVNETDIDALRDCTCSATPHPHFSFSVSDFEWQWLDGMPSMSSASRSSAGTTLLVCTRVRNVNHLFFFPPLVFFFSVRFLSKQNISDTWRVLLLLCFFLLFRFLLYFLIIFLFLLSIHFRNRRATREGRTIKFCSPSSRPSKITI